MIKIVLLLLVTFLSNFIITDSYSSNPIISKIPIKKVIPKKSSLVIDCTNLNKKPKILYQESANEIRHPASLTKIMTVYLLLESVQKGKVKFNTKFKVSKFATQQMPSKLNLKIGETISVLDCIKALLVKSANDVAVVVAEGLAGSVSAFCKIMNKKAKSLGMKSTHYENPSGVPDIKQVTCANDIAILGLSLINKFSKYWYLFSLKNFTYKNKNYNTHCKILRWYNGSDGAKTGYICASGFNLWVTANRFNKEGKSKRLFAIVFGERSGRERDFKAARLLDKYFGEYTLSNNNQKFSNQNISATLNKNVKISKNINTINKNVNQQNINKTNKNKLVNNKDINTERNIKSKNQLINKKNTEAKRNSEDKNKLINEKNTSQDLENNNNKKSDILRKNLLENIDNNINKVINKSKNNILNNETKEPYKKNQLQSEVAVSQNNNISNDKVTKFSTNNKLQSKIAISQSNNMSIDKMVEFNKNNKLQNKAITSQNSKTMNNNQSKNKIVKSQGNNKQNSLNNNIKSNTNNQSKEQNEEIVLYEVESFPMDDIIKSTGKSKEYFDDLYKDDIPIQIESSTPIDFSQSNKKNNKNSNSKNRKRNTKKNNNKRNIKLNIKSNTNSKNTKLSNKQSNTNNKKTKFK